MNDTKIIVFLMYSIHLSDQYSKSDYTVLSEKFKEP